MLRLCPGDNLGVRFALGALLTMAGRHSEALSYLQAWLDDSRAAPSGKTPPFKTPLSPERVEALSQYTKADFPYSAALAAFHLWGDCMLARQYLLIGARLNPQVLLKILAKIDRPSMLSFFCTLSHCLTSCLFRPPSCLLPLDERHICSDDAMNRR